jgi:LmbE family N-acetylglucosaminyl deacetylase
MKPTAREPLHPQVVLGVGAHPDDLDFIAGGALASFAAEGAQVYYLILTDGSRGSADLHADGQALVATRKAEQDAAVTATGAAGSEFLDYTDGQLEVTMELKKDIIRVIRKLKPDVVITFDPSMLYSATQGYINHPDHRAAGQATLDAVFPLARDHLSFPELLAEGYEPHKVKTVLLNNFEKQDFFIDISQTMDAKVAALAAHASQMPNMPAVETMVREMASDAGGKIGSRYAEGFVRIDTMA